MSAARTPGPWAVSPSTDFNNLNAYTIRQVQPTKLGDRVPVAEVHMGKADAEFIVTACNAHDDLVKALREIADMHGGADWENSDPHIVAGELARIARAALAEVTPCKP